MYLSQNYIEMTKKRLLSWALTSGEQQRRSEYTDGLCFSTVHTEIKVDPH